MNDSRQALLARQQYDAAQTLLGQGRLAEAEQRYRAALRIDPDHGDALQGLGLVCLQSGRFDEAVDRLREAAARNPHSAAVYNNLGITLVAAKRFEEAADAYKRSIALDPRLPETYNDLGMTLMWLGRNEEAVAEFENALALKPDFVHALGNLGEALGSLGRHEQAANCFKRVFIAVPGLALAHYNYGNAMMVLGRIAEACHAFERTVALTPKDTAAHRALAGTKTFHEGDPQIAALEDMAKDEASLSEAGKAELRFALAKVYSDLERHDLAFAHLEKGNAVKRRLVVYEEETELGVLREMAAAFTPEIMQAKGGQGDPSDVPVFVLGMPRSGTTLVERILASHPDVFGAGELTAFGDAAGGGYEPKPLPFDVASLSGDELRRLGGRYLAQVLPRAPQAKRIIDKLPANFRFIGLIRLALPNARIIHVRRDPRDTCFSCYSQLFVSNLEYTYDLGELGRTYKAYEALMAHWRAVLPEGAMLEVEYETLVGNFEAEAQRLVAFCGLEWDARCLKFYEAAGAVQSASAVQVRQPVFHSSVGRWRHYKEYLGPLLEILDAAQFGKTP
jgi:tetratricopeptide (TPR) repeat protein